MNQRTVNDQGYRGLAGFAAGQVVWSAVFVFLLLAVAGVAATHFTCAVSELCRRPWPGISGEWPAGSASSSPRAHRRRATRGHRAHSRRRSSEIRAGSGGYLGVSWLSLKCNLPWC